MSSTYVYHPTTGAKFTLTNDATTDPAELMTWANKIFEAGWLPEPPELGQADVINITGVIRQLYTRRKDGDQVSRLLYYTDWASEYGATMTVWINGQEDIDKFEAASGLQFDKLPEFNGQAPNRNTPAYDKFAKACDFKLFRRKIEAETPVGYKWELISYGATIGQATVNSAPTPPPVDVEQAKQTLGNGNGKRKLEQPAPPVDLAAAFPRPDDDPAPQRATFVADKIVVGMTQSEPQRKKYVVTSAIGTTAQTLDPHVFDGWPMEVSAYNENESIKLDPPASIIWEHKTGGKNGKTYEWNEIVSAAPVAALPEPDKAA